MEKSESIKEIVAAVIKVMSEVKGIEKNLTVGKGMNSYKGVADKDVKQTIGESMQKNGLVIFPTGIESKSNIESWMEETQYGKKHKQSIFTEVVTSYMLCHISGEYMELKGSGHGVDSQDKSAGKATTYALKYTLLYTFLVPTGKIDDADIVHSDDVPVKQKPQPRKKDLLTPIHPKWNGAVEFLKGKGTMTEILASYEVSKEFQEKLINQTLDS